MNNCYISNVEYHKHLGVSYDKRMIFNIHCSDIITKSYSKFNLLKHICPKVNGHVFLKLYKSYILPIIEYSNLCFTPTQTQLYKIEKIQKKISKYICFKLNKTNLNYSDRLKALNLISLKKRREVQILKLIHNTTYKYKANCANWFENLTLYKRSRNGNFLKCCKNRIVLTDKCIFNYGTKLFNNLPKIVRNFYYFYMTISRGESYNIPNRKSNIFRKMTSKFGL